jgi:hypothetical protein
MAQRRKKAATRDRPSEQAMRDQEVLRANRELAAYFKGRRTEREARAALKIIKAFVRERERLDVNSRPSLPGAAGTKAPDVAAAAAGSRKRRKRTRAAKAIVPESVNEESTTALQ